MSTDRFLLSTNPFSILGLGSRDDRHSIIAAAEDRSLQLDSESCQHARATLTNPRRRLDAEFGWFPGVAPRTAAKAVSATTVEEVESLPLSGVAKANALMNAASGTQPAGTAALSRFVVAMALAVDGIKPERVLLEVNEDREIAGFPPFVGAEVAAEVLRDQQTIWRRATIAVLDRAPTAEMAEALSAVVRKQSAANTFPVFIHDLVDDYAVRSQPYMASVIAGAERLVEKARELAPRRTEALAPIIAALRDMLKNWKRLTYPIQMSATLRGQTDSESEQLAFMLRSLSIDLFNEQSLLDASREVSTMVSEAFSALPRIADKLAEDGKALRDVARKATERDAELTYTAEVGTFIKSRLSIDARSLEWQGQRFPLAKIRSARWGAVRHSVNGIPTGTDYLIAWRDERFTTTVNLRNGKIYDAFVDRLWRALNTSIFAAITDQLRAGRELRF